MTAPTFENVCGVVLRGRLDHGRMIVCLVKGPHEEHRGRPQNSKTRGAWRWRAGNDKHARKTYDLAADVALSGVIGVADPS